MSARWYERLLLFLRRAFAAPVNSGTGGSSPPAPTPDNPAPPKPDAGAGDDLDLSTVWWLGTPVKGAAVEFLLSSASIKGDMIHTMYHKYSWPSEIINDKSCDAVVHLFYEQGDRVVGGKFDFWRDGGQPDKGLKNVITGYHGHRMPAPGTPTWEMISSHDGERRSNTVRVEWR